MKFGIAAGLALCAFSAQAQEKQLPYFPTPLTIVEQMLKLAGVQPGEKVFDVGSGDGRIVIMAAQKFGADATGVELDEDLWKQSTLKIKRLRLDAKARIVHGDMLKQDYSSADVVTAYLLPEWTRKMRPIFERQLKKGARVIAHDFEFLEWTPVKTIDIPDDGEGRSHRIILYQR